MSRKSEDEQGVWSSLLNQVRESSLSKLPSDKFLVILGDESSGKYSLVGKLKGTEDSEEGNGMIYEYLTIKDEYREDVTRLGVWIFEETIWFHQLLKFVLNEQTFPNCTVLIVGSMEHPWELLSSIEKWATLLEEYIWKLKLGTGNFEKFQQEVLRKYRAYLEPSDEIHKRITSVLKEGPCEIVPLGENTLKNNLGLEVMIVITKTDYMSTLEKDSGFKDEDFDFIQQAIRKFCLNYGAALFYTSVKENENIQLLFKYLKHRIYDFRFKNSALVVERHLVFIPAGWDNDNKIAILNENITSFSPTDNFSATIVKPQTSKPFICEPEIVAEHDQAFLGRMLHVLNQQKTPPLRLETPSPNHRRGANEQRTSSIKSEERRCSNISDHPRSIPGTPMGFNTPKRIANSESLLQTFFQGLMVRKTSSPSGLGGVITQRSAESSEQKDMFAELDSEVKIKTEIKKENSTEELKDI